ncbi:MAG: hypothetical protein IJP48_04960 [Synergistaceae bacterium]|nr:hypothetical protein [Synergistaceae bacterium]
MTLDEALKTSCESLAGLTANDGEAFNGLRERVESAFRNLQAAMFPSHANSKCRSINESLTRAADKLTHAITKTTGSESESETITAKLIARLPDIRKILWSDITAAYQGDPAAKSPDEIILAYPAFTAISAYRVAHELYIMNANLISRIITEYAHRLTGIDIHPGASIGENFFIDHGTGVVIGETSTIGKRVKIYQNVTIGAKSFDVAPDGSLVKGIKRHPDIGNDVVIYAGATILGGDTVIGDNCVIGGNVWLTHSVKAGSVVLNER